MNSKEAITRIDDVLYINEVRTQVQDEILSLLKIIEQDLDRLEQLEKENQELKERYKKRAELCNEFCEYIKQYEKALEILKEVVSLNCDKTLETERQFLRLSKEEYELLKEVLE